jgi:hypothetical protein
VTVNVLPHPVFRREGDVVLESPYTERTQRNMVRAQFQMLDDRLGQGKEDVDDADLYESDEDNGGNGGNDPSQLN